MNINKLNQAANLENRFFQRFPGLIIFIVLALGFSVFVHGFILEIAVVQGVSMEPTLFPGDRLVVLKLEYFFSKPRAKDIVVLRFINEDSGSDNNRGNGIEYIKRIIAVPNDCIDLKYQQVYLNNERLEEHYALGITRQKKGDYPIQLTDQEYFVMGDNREYSRDSRDIGLVSNEAFVGKAVFRIWPLTQLGFIH